MERWMIVYGLPLEVWMDIFCFPWISREEFGQLVDRIGNFKFAENAQFYLQAAFGLLLPNLVAADHARPAYSARDFKALVRRSCSLPTRFVPNSKRYATVINHCELLNLFPNGVEPNPARAASIRAHNSARFQQVFPAKQLKVEHKMERWMIVYFLPLEVWMDIFCFPWITREEFGQLVHGIGNFKFAEHAQFYLHEWGKHILGGLHFTKKNGIYKYLGYGQNNLRLELPQTPMPENIKSFAYIEINCFDTRTVYFLRRIGPLLSDLKIHLLDKDCLENERAILTNLAPLLNGGVYALNRIHESLVPIARQYFFAKLKVLTVYSTHKSGMQQENVNILIDWLAQPANEPRLCKFRGVGPVEQISKTVRQQFRDATTPSTFAVQIFNSNRWQLAEFHEHNGIGEELHGVQKFMDFQITRHRTNGNMQLDEWIKENRYRERGPTITFYQPIFRSFDDGQMNVPSIDDEEEQDDQQQPSTSKNA